MKSCVYLLTFLLGTVLAADLSICRAQSPAAVAARITKLTCHGEWIQNKSGAKRPLLPNRDEGLALSPRDTVRCVGSGVMKVLVPEGLEEISSSQAAFTIPDVPAGPESKYSDIVRALGKLGIPGATRGDAQPSSIRWPSDYSVVIPATFAIRWTPIAQKIHISVMSDAKDATLWGPTEIDGKTGLFKSGELSSFLAAYKAKSDNSGLVLILAPTNGADWEEAHFSLLKGRTEQELNDQLEFWKTNTDGVALHLGLGYSFSRYKLFAESAEEYDTALKSAPDSRYLLEDAMQANRLAGREDRVKDIQTHLASLPQTAK